MRPTPGSPMYGKSWKRRRTFSLSQAGNRLYVCFSSMLPCSYALSRRTILFLDEVHRFNKAQQVREPGSAV